MKKNEFEESLLYLFHMATSYDYRWNRFGDVDEYPKGNGFFFRFCNTETVIVLWKKQN